MSSVDNRIVKMQFDNEQFEKNVSKSMTTLDKFEEKLQFKKAINGVKGLQIAFDSVAFDKLASSIDSIEKRLSGVGVMAATVVSRITNSLIDGAMQIERATIGQIKTGGWARAMKLENAKFTVEGLKLDWTEMLKAINYGVQDTAYGLDAAAAAASQLAASGVTYKESINGANDSLMHKSLRAISGVAAMTNSSYEEISRIFAAAAGKGVVMGDELNQLAGRGLNAAAILAEAFGTTEDVIRDAASAREITFKEFAEAMDDAFGAHAKEANKTFNGALSNMKAALSRFGAVFATPVIQKTNKFFIALTDRIKEMKNAISDTTANGEVLEKHLEGHFAEMWEKLIDLADVLVHKIDLTWFWKVADAADAATIKITGFIDKLQVFFGKNAKSTANTAKTVYDLSKITKDELDLANDVIRGNYGNGQKRVKALAEAAEKLGLDPVKIQEYVNAVSAYGYSFEKAKIQVIEATDSAEEFEETAQKSSYSIEDILTNLRYSAGVFSLSWDQLKINLSYFVDAVKYGLKDASVPFYNVSESLKKLARSFREFLEIMEPTHKEFLIFSNFISRTSGVLLDFISAIGEAVAVALDFAKSLMIDERGTMFDLLDTFSKKIQIIWNRIKVAFENIQIAVYTLVGAIVDAFDANYLDGRDLIFDVIQKTAERIAEFTSLLIPSEDEMLVFSDALQTIIDIALDVYATIQSVKLGILDFVTSLIKGSKQTGRFADFLNSTVKILKSLFRIAKSISKLVSGIFRAIAVAFFRVFKPADVANYLDMFTMGIADLFELLEPSEEFIYALSDALTVIMSIIAGVIDKILALIGLIGTFFSKISGKFKNDTAVEDSFDGMSTVASLAMIAIDGLMGALDKFLDFISKIPDKLGEFSDALNQQEGVIRLKDALKGLWESMKGSVDIGLKPFRTFLDEIGNVTGVTWTLDDVAKWFGWLAGKLADIIEKIPGWYEKITSFFTGVKDKIVEFFKGVDKVVGVSDLQEAIASSIEGDNTTLFEKIKAIVGRIGDWVFSSLEEIDWSNIGETSMTVAALALIWQMIKVSEGIANLLTSIKTIPDAVTKIFKSFNNFILIATSSLANFSKAALIGVIAASVVGIAMSVAILANIPEEKLTNAMSVVSVIMGFVLIMAKLIVSAIEAISKAKTKQFESAIANASNAIQLAKINLWQGLVDVLAIVALMIGIAYATRIIVRTIVEMYELLEHIHLVGGKIGATLIIVGVIAAGILVTAGVIFIVMYLIKRRLNKLANANPNDTRLFQQGIEGWKMAQMNMFAIAALMLSFGAALYLVVQAIKIISEIWVDGDTVLIIGLVAALILVLAGASLLVTKAISRASIDWRATLGFAALLFVFSLSLIGIVAEIAGLALLFKGADMVGMKEDLILAVGSMVLIILAMGAAVAMIGSSFQHGVTTKLNTGAMSIALLGLIILVLVVSHAIKLIMDAVGTSTNTVAVVTALSAVVVILGILMGTLALVANYAKKLTDAQVKNFNKLSVSLLLLSSVVIVIAIAMAIIGLTCQNLDPNVMTKAAIFLFLAFAGLDIAMMGIIRFIKNNSRFPYDGFKKVATGILILASSLLIIALAIGAMAALKDVWGDTRALLSIFNTLGVVSVLIAALALLATSLGSGAGGATAGADFLIKLGEALILFSAGLVVLALAMNMIQGIDPFTILAFAGAMAVMLAMLAVLVKVMSTSTSSFQTLAGIAIVVLSLGGSVILLGIGLGIINAVLAIMTPLLPHLAIGLGAVFGVLQQYWPITLAIFVIIVAVVGLVTYATLKALPALTTIIQGIGTVVQAIGTTIVGVVSAVFNRTRAQTSQIPGRMKFIAASMMIAVGSAITETGPEILQKFGKVIFTLMDWLIKMTGPLAGKLLDWLVELLDALAVQIDVHANRISASITNIVGSLIDLVIKALSDMIGGFMSFLGEAWGSDKLKQWGEGLKEGASQMVAEGAETRHKRMEEAIKEDEKLKDMVDEYAKTEEEIMNAGSSVKSSGGESGSGSFFKNMFGSKDGASAISDIGGITNAVKGLGSSMDGASISAENLGVKINGMPSAQQDQLIAAGKAFRTEAGDVFTLKGIDNGTDSFITQLKGDATDMFQENPALDNLWGEGGMNLGQDMVDGETTAIENGWGDVYGAADENAMAVGDAATDNIDYVKEKNAELSAAGADAIKDNLGKYEENQSNNLAGVIRAIRTYAREGGPVDTATEYFCSQMHHYFEQYNQIASPSKLYYKTTGFIGQAIVNSINDSSYAAGLAMEDLSNAMIVSFGNPLDYVGQIASGEIEYDPSIRPVLDTSNIARGAYGINAMLDNQNMAISGFSGKLATDITGLDTTNMNMVNELRALRSDMNTMTEQITNMQIVMDGGQLVGAIAPTMDNALGNRATMRRRGN